MDLATGKEIILEIVRSMQANLEPLLFSTIAPARYYVYLHPGDHQRLEGVMPLIVDQAEDRGVRTDAEAERQHRDKDEPGALAQHAEGVSNILEERVHGDTLPFRAPPGVTL